MNQPVPVNPPNLRSHIVAASKMSWQPTQFEGIEMKILYQDDEGRSTILFKMAQAASCRCTSTLRSNRLSCSKARWKTPRGAAALATSSGGPAATSTSRTHLTARRSWRYSTGRTGFSTGRSFSRRRRLVERGSVARHRATPSEPIVKNCRAPICAIPIRSLRTKWSRT